MVEHVDGHGDVEDTDHERQGGGVGLDDRRRVGA
jgi:hypothetical protein